MDSYLVWLAAGCLLVIVELLTGTFYLLMLGIAAFAGSAAAWFRLGFWPETLIAAAVGIAGVFWVQRRRKVMPQADMPSLDVGQAVKLDGWISQEQGAARVRYRDALWDAQVAGERDFGAGQILYIHAIDGNTLKVALTKP